MDTAASSLISAIAGLISAVVAMLAYLRPNPRGRKAEGRAGSQRNRGLKSLGLGLGVGVVVYAIGIITLLQVGDRHTAAAAATTTSLPSCEQTFKITSPPDGHKISGKAGAEIKGTACRGDLVWLFDRDPYDGILYQVNSEPLDIVNGTWEHTDKPIGNDENDDIDTVYTIVAIRASAACNSALKAALPGPDNTVSFGALPDGCPDINGEDGIRKVRVKKVRP